MSQVLRIVGVVIGAVVVGVLFSFVWAFIAAWCLVGVWAVLPLAGIPVPFALSWSWWLVLAFWLFGIIISLLFNGLKVRTTKD